MRFFLYSACAAAAETFFPELSFRHAAGEKLQHRFPGWGNSLIRVEKASFSPKQAQALLFSFFFPAYLMQTAKQYAIIPDYLFQLHEHKKRRARLSC
jgi:hypothetical protein